MRSYIQVAYGFTKYLPKSLNAEQWEQLFALPKVLDRLEYLVELYEEEQLHRVKARTAAGDDRRIQKVLSAYS